MRKLARTDETSNGVEERQILKPKTETKPMPVNINIASRCVVLHNMFDAEEFVRPLFLWAFAQSKRTMLTSETGKKVKIGSKS